MYGTNRLFRTGCSGFVTPLNKCQRNHVWKYVMKIVGILGLLLKRILNFSCGGVYLLLAALLNKRKTLVMIFCVCFINRPSESSRLCLIYKYASIQG